MADSRRMYEPGDIIYENRPFTYVLCNDVQSIFCDFCFKRNTAVKACASCQYTRYCDKKCQKLAWQEHKFECERLKYLPDHVFADRVRLAAKILFKLKKKDSSESYDIVGGYRRSFGNMLSYKEEAMNSPRHYYEILQHIKCLSLFLKPEDMPSRDDAIELFGKILYNSFAITTAHCDIGKAVYLGASIFDHSCIPNATFCFDGTKLIVKAIKQIRCDDIRKINIAYYSSIGFERGRLDFFRKCHCEDCSLPYGESFRTKILDKEKAIFAIEASKDALDFIDCMKSYFPTGMFSEMINHLADEVLSKQNGILDDTNMYRMPFFLYKMTYNAQKPNEIIKYGNKLIPLIVAVYGDKSIELFHPYQMMKQAYADVGNDSQKTVYEKKLRDLLLFQGHNYESLFTFNDANFKEDKGYTF